MLKHIFSAIESQPLTLNFLIELSLLDTLAEANVRNIV